MAQETNYQSWYESYEGKKEGAFMRWYHSYQGKKVVNWVYSIGASVVIIGALFKILHWPGASMVLMAGMFTEAFLFLIGTLEAPHEEFHWANVFPELLEYGSPLERVERSKEQLGAVKGARQFGGGGNGTSTPAPQQSVPSLDEKELSALKSGIAGLATTAGQLAELGKVAEGTTKLTQKMEAAGQAVDQFAGVQSQLAASTQKLENHYAQLGVAYQNVQAEVQQVAEMTKSHQKQVEGLNSQLSAVNAAYELQLNSLKAQAEAVKAQTESVKANTKSMETIAQDMQQMQTAMADAAKNATIYEDGAKKLASQIADLNKVYGNMLNALA